MSPATVVAATVIRVAAAQHQAPYVLAVVSTGASLRLLRLSGDVAPAVGTAVELDVVDAHAHLST